MIQYIQKGNTNNLISWERMVIAYIIWYTRHNIGLGFAEAQMLLSLEVTMFKAPALFWSLGIHCETMRTPRMLIYCVTSYCHLSKYKLHQYCLRLGVLWCPIYYLTNTANYTLPMNFRYTYSCFSKSITRPNHVTTGFDSHSHFDLFGNNESEFKYILFCY